MKVIIKFTVCCDNLRKGKFMAVEKPEKLSDFFLPLCGGHPGFFRAMLCIRGTSHGPVSVCPSVTSRSSTKTAERIELVFGV